MVYQQSRRWLAAGCFEAIVHDLRAILRFAAGKKPEPTAAIFDGRTMQSTPESGGRAGYDGYKRRKGSKVHMAVDTLGHLLAVHVTPANEQERDQVAVLAEAVQEVTGESVEIAYVDQGYTGDERGRRRGQLRHPAGGGEPARGEEGVRAACRGDGSWSGRTAGWRGSAGWHGTTSGSARPWRGCTTSPSAS